MSEQHDPNRRLSEEGPHGLGETEEQHALHSNISTRGVWGLSAKYEEVLFYFWMTTSICCEIAAAAIGAYYHSWNAPFVGIITAFMVLHWAGWIQTVQGMLQRASWVRDEGDLPTRRQFLHLAVRLNRLQLVCACFCATSRLIILTTFAANSSGRPGDLPPSLRSTPSPTRLDVLAPLPTDLHLVHRLLRHERLQQHHLGVRPAAV